MASGHSSSSHGGGGFSGGGFSGGGFSGGGFSSPSFHSSSSHSSWGDSSSSWGSSSSSHSSSHSSSSRSSSPKIHYSSGERPISERSHGSTPEQRPSIPRCRRGVDYTTAGRHHDDDFIRHMIMWHLIFGNNRHYIYYPRPYTDKNDYTWKRGYYDESGKHYDNVVMPGLINVVTCPNCGKSFTREWFKSATKGEETECPYCKKSFCIEKVEDEEFCKEKQKMDKEYTWAHMDWTWLKITLAVLGALIAVVGAIFGIRAAIKADQAVREANAQIDASTVLEAYVTYTGYYGANDPESPPNNSAGKTTTRSDTIYVAAIGRECSFNGENYVDPETGCEFWFNDTVRPGQWQYWYSGYSEQFGDYGWMEYDDKTGEWYVETYSGNWIVVPNPQEKFWHMYDAFNPDSSYDPNGSSHTPAEPTATVTPKPTLTVDFIVITDTITFQDVTPGYTYRFSGTIYNGNAQAIGTFVTDSFTPHNSSGTCQIKIRIPAEIRDEIRVIIRSERTY